MYLIYAVYETTDDIEVSSHPPLTEDEEEPQSNPATEESDHLLVAQTHHNPDSASSTAINASLPKTEEGNGMESASVSIEMEGGKSNVKYSSSVK